MNLKDIQEYQKELVKEAHDYFGRYRNWEEEQQDVLTELVWGEEEEEEEEEEE